MANEIQRAGPNRVLQRTLTIKGDQPPAGVVGAEIVPTLPLEVDRPEWAYLSATRWGHWEASQAAVAGQFCKSAIWNPPFSQVLVVVSRLTVYTGAPAGTVLSALLYTGGPEAVDFSAFMGGAPVTGPCLNMDFRWGEKTGAQWARGPTTVQHGEITAVADFNVAQFYGDICAPINVVAGWIPDRIPWIILPPGWFLGVRGAQNMALCAEWCWYERGIEPNEQAVAGAIK